MIFIGSKNRVERPTAVSKKKRIPRNAPHDPEIANLLVTGFLETLAAKAGVPEQVKLSQLWLNWHLVVGEEINALGAVPLRHRDHRLVIGAPDPIAMQELLYYREELVERLNSFMEEPFFKEVQVQNSLGHRSLLEGDSLEEKAEEAPMPPAPTGKFLGGMNPDSPVARCYLAFVRAGQQRKK